MYVFIINPNAGNGRALRIFEKLQKSQLFRELNSKYYFSEYEGHAEVIASSLKEDNRISRIIVIGGDGTIYEVMNGIGKSSIPLGFIPGGSGNDFARGTGITGSEEAILRAIVSGDKMIDYWLGTYIRNEQQPRFFVNSIGFGFDAQIAHTANTSFYKRIFNNLRTPTASYIIALLQVIGQFNPMTVELTIDGRKRIVEDCLLVSIGNHPYYGGGMKIMPNAKVQPDSFSVLIVHSVPKWKVLFLFLTVFTGRHETIKGVELLVAKKLRIQSEHPIYMQTDGQTTTCQESEITKCKNAVKIVTT